MKFTVTDPQVEPFAAVPMLRFTLGVEDALPIHTIALRCQILLDTRRRSYTPAETERLVHMFGEAPRWASTLQRLLWTHIDMMVPGFDTATQVPLRVPCTYDLEVSTARYFEALDQGEVPVLFQFSGTIFRNTQPGFHVERVGWDLEAECRVPVATWREVIDRYYPGTAFVRLRRDTLARLLACQQKHGLTSLDE
ncbi:MAG TPA: DUF6084 family protein, partial [Candidatus Xenobia bacterium]